ncbi:alpha/beta hydrolase family protein [Halobacillus salinus]|nr:alpha/beta fold hydrolase [Halobacillus salinus]
MKHAFVQNQDILGDLLIPDEKINVKIGLVWLPGLPNQPLMEDMTHQLVQQGFTVLNARYPGSWQSYGKFGPSTSVEGAKLGMELLRSGKTTDLKGMQQVLWDIDKVVLIGNSYGGAVALTALATSDLSDGAVVFCPMLDPAAQNENPNEPEEDLSTMYPFLKRCHENTFRDIDPQEWEDFIIGNHSCNPVTYIDNLARKPILLLHGKEDRSIRAWHTESFFEELREAGAKNAELHLVDGIGHGRGLRTTTQDLWVKWLKEHFS